MQENNFYGKSKKIVFFLKRIGILSIILSVFSIICILYDFGFEHQADVAVTLRKVYAITVIGGSISIIARYFIREYRPRLKSLPFDLLLLIFLLLVLNNNAKDGGAGNAGIFSQPFWIYPAVILVFIREMAAVRIEFKKASLNPAQMFVTSFFIIIIIGTFLLMLPKATVSGISVVDAFFTSVSAVCVTGLAVVDTGSYFTYFGQVIIFLLFQAGGLGIMTFTSYFSYFFRGNASFESQLILRDYTNTDKLSEVFAVLKRILLITLLIEGAGTLLIFNSLDRGLMPSLSDRLFFSGFHAVSGFCNAGFSLLRDSFYDSSFRFNYPLHLVIAFLIIMGGLGFPIVFNLIMAIKSEFRSLFRWLIFREKRIRTPWLININTRLVLITTLALLAVGSLTIFILEYNNTLAEHRFAGKAIEAFFGAVTARTAGFNTFDMSALSVPAALIFMFLMWVGASPASTGGGIKTSTFAVAILSVLGIARGSTRLEVYKREIPDASVNRAFAIIFLSVIVIGLSIGLLSMLNPGIGFLDISFECISAYGTVGLSRGITADLTTAGKVVIALTMFIGRVSMLSILIAFFKRVYTGNYRYPGESILIN